MFTGSSDLAMFIQHMNMTVNKRANSTKEIS